MSLLNRLLQVEENRFSPPNILYKYISPQRIDILQHCRIRISQPGAFNDPFEGYPHEVSYDSDKEILESIQQDEHMSGIIQAIHEALFKVGIESREWTLDDVKGDLLNAYKSAHDIIHNTLIEETIGTHPSDRFSVQWIFDRLLGVVPLSEVNDDILMWGLYASSHSGYVIGFNAHHEFFSQTGYGVRKVQYSEERPTIVIGAVWDIRFHLTKSLYWQYEKEWRLLAPIPIDLPEDTSRDTLGYPIILFNLPPAAINCIVFGARMSSDNRDRLRDIVNQNHELKHVKFFRSQIDPNLYRINIKPL